MALRKCLDCDYPVSSSAWKCPQCGRANPAQRTDGELLRDIVLGDKDASFTERIKNKMFSKVRETRAADQSRWGNSSGGKWAGGADLDVYFNLLVAPNDLASGCVKTLVVNEEKIEVKIPLGAKYGTKLRLKRKGNLNQRTMERGDLYLVLTR